MFQNQLTTWFVIISYVLTGWLAHGLHSHVHSQHNHTCAESAAIVAEESGNSAQMHQCCHHGHVHQHTVSIESGDLTAFPLSEDPAPTEHHHDHDGCQVCQLLFTAVTLSISFGYSFETVAIPAEKHAESVFVIAADVKAYDTRGPPVV